LLARLERLRPRAIDCIRRRLLRHPEKWGAALAVEVGFEHLDRGLPFVAYAMDADGAQASVERGGEIDLLGGERVFPVSMRVYFARDWRHALEHTPDALDMAAPVLSRWFASVWTEAGGKAFPLLATIEIHDSNRRVALPSSA
jgi:hypothetical protein